VRVLSHRTKSLVFDGVQAWRPGPGGFVFSAVHQSSSAPLGLPAQSVLVEQVADAVAPGREKSLETNRGMVEELSGAFAGARAMARYVRYRTVQAGSPTEDALHALHD